MSDLFWDARVLADRHGPHAAGKAFSWALDCALDIDHPREAYWLDVALLVMEIQGRGRVVNAQVSSMGGSTISGFGTGISGSGAGMGSGCAGTGGMGGGAGAGGGGK